MPTIELRARRALAEHRQALVRRFGWAGPQLGCTADPRGRALRLGGEAISRRALAAAVAAVTATLPQRWRVETTGVEVAAPGRWLLLGPGITRLWRTPAINISRCPGGHVIARGRELCTELVAGDGPVGLLAVVGASALVRAGDGTLGWTEGGLGASTAAPLPGWRRRASGEAPPPGRRRRLSGEAPAVLALALRGLRGAPYRLGGTTARGVDCSGLVQRGLRSALGVVLPRHSSDQLALAAAPARALGEPGDLLFMWGGGESPCHVGVVLRGARPGARTLIHASSRRGQVIEEPLELALARAAVVRHVELEQVLAL